jgi:hypothetical protein
VIWSSAVAGLTALWGDAGAEGESVAKKNLSRKVVISTNKRHTVFINESGDGGEKMNECLCAGDPYLDCEGEALDRVNGETLCPAHWGAAVMLMSLPTK